MTNIEHKKILMDSIGPNELIGTDIYKFTDSIKYVKVSKIHKSGNYWFTVNTYNIGKIKELDISDFVFSGPKGYYIIPMNILTEFFLEYDETPKDGKYHFAIYPQTHLLSRTKENSIDVSEYYNELPEKLVEGDISIESEDENEAKDSSEYLDNRNYFVVWTKETSIDQITKEEHKNGFWHTGCYQRKEKTRVGDITFYVQKGERSKVNWDIGLSAICEIVEIRNDLEGKKTKNGTEYFDLKLKPILIFPRIISKEEFDNYIALQEICHITNRNGKNDPDQVNWWFSKEEEAKKLVGVLIHLLPDIKDEFLKIFGKRFSVPLDLETVQALDDASKSESEYKLPSHISVNNVSDQPLNLILYGAPGTGKSFSLKEKVNQLFPEIELKRRITFHPNYSYRNFVGSYKPKPIYKETDINIFKADRVTDHDHQKEPIIEYAFEPGPLLEMYVKAYHNPKHNFVLVIEEINRANTAAVFGDVFQLLDRDVFGKSEYPITLEQSAHDFLKENEVYDNEIALPSNLYLWATMNNADQGVMPMDSAFKRRWSFEHLRLNEFEEKVKDLEINFPWGEKVKWNKFRETINNKLSDLKIHEDKFIGPFFMGATEIQDNKAVLNKLLLYLKEDVLRYKSGVFSEDLKTFSDVSEKFLALEGNPSANVFSESISFEKIIEG